MFVSRINFILDNVSKNLNLIELMVNGGWGSFKHKHNLECRTKITWNTSLLFLSFCFPLWNSIEMIISCVSIICLLQWSIIKPYLWCMCNCNIIYTNIFLFCGRSNVRRCLIKSFLILSNACLVFAVGYSLLSSLQFSYLHPSNKKTKQIFCVTPLTVVLSN